LNRRAQLPWLAGPVVALLVVGTPAAQDDTLRYVVKGERIVFTNVPTPDALPVPGMSADETPATADNPELPVTLYDRYIDQVANEYGLSPALIKAVALVESGFNPHAVSNAGAQGLMQLMPATARAYGVADAFDPLANLRAGTHHLSNLLDEFDGDLTLALAAYNAGSGAVRRSNGVPAYPETVNYVRKVHEKLGRQPQGLPAAGRRVDATRPVRFKVLGDGSVLISN